MFGAGTNGDGRDTCDANGFPLADQVFRFPVRCAGGYSNGSTVLRSGDDVPRSSRPAVPRPLPE
jgi:hypothetical protein